MEEDSDVPVIAWGWIVASAAAGALAAVSLFAQVLLVSGDRRLFFDLEISLVAATVAGAVIGAVLALPGAFRRRVLHPSFGFWVIFLFGSVDWLGDLEGTLRWSLQGVLLVLLLAGAFSLRRAGLGPAVLSGAALATLVTVPVGILVWKNAFAPTEDEWRFEDPEFSHRVAMEAGALRARTEAGRLPDIWVVVPDQYPSISEAVRRGVPYPEAELIRLRERGWRIRDDAWADVPNTAVTLAHTFSLSTQLMNGGRQVPAMPARVVQLFEQEALLWEPSFFAPPPSSHDP